MKVAVVGAGTMGTGIAQVVAMSGFDVTLHDVEQVALDNSMGKIKDSLEKLAMKNASINSKEVINRITLSTDYATLQNKDIIIEAINENIDHKHIFYKKLDALCEEQTIFVTNTSSLQVSEIAEATNRKDRFCGLHFFNPVPLMDLVEMTFLDETSERTKATIESFVERLGKTVIRVADTPLFIVNRILVPMICEAIELVGEGTASAADVDRAMKLGAHHPIGPLWMADMIGLDTMLNIQQALYDKTGKEKYKVPPLLIEMVEQNLLGRKTGKGFYEY